MCIRDRFTIVLLIHLTSLRSFGVSYLAPISPFSRTSIVDTMFRLPLKYIFHRKKNISETLPN